jgi:hypothetical protein
LISKKINSDVVKPKSEPEPKPITDSNELQLQPTATMGKVVKAPKEAEWQSK